MSACADVEDCATATPSTPSTGVRRFAARVAAFAKKWVSRTLWVLVGLAVLVVLTFLRLRSDVHDALGLLGPRLSEAGMLQHLTDRNFPDSPQDRVLMLNGQPLHLSTRVVDEDMDQALSDSLVDCPTRQELGGPVTNSGRCYTVCIHPPNDVSGGPSLNARLRSFSSSLDMSNLGSFDYTYAEEHGDRTALIHLTSSDDLDVQALLPLEGDAPGVALADFPRPPEGRRILQAYEQGQPYRLTVFARSSHTPAELTRWYQQHTDSQIWHEADVDTQARLHGVELPADHGLIFWRNEDRTRFTLVSFDSRPANDDTPAGTTVAIAEAL